MRYEIKSLDKFPSGLCKQIKGIFTDIDDTLTNDGKLLPIAYEALFIAKSAGLIVVPITGRPAGWCDHIARMWPVTGVVGENGGLYFYHDGQKMRRHYIFDQQTREKNREKLKKIAQIILKEVPGSAISADQLYREFDLAIDYCEDVKPLPKEQVLKIVEIFKKFGAVAKISSIHVNGWFGNYDKLTMCKIFLKNVFQIDLDSMKEYFIFCGDSPNDEPMFEFFPNSVAVANIKNFLPLMNHLPKYITTGIGGYGFRELVDYIVSNRY